MLAIRRWDDTAEAWGPLDNPVGPACVDTSGRVAYALDGQLLPKEEWERRRPSSEDPGTICKPKS